MVALILKNSMTLFSLIATISLQIFFDHHDNCLF